MIRTPSIASLLMWLFAAAILAGPAEAIPQFSLTTGNRCINCHATVQGGGLRDELGRYSTEGVGLSGARWQSLGGAGSLLDGALLLGADARVQMARSHQSSDANRRVFPMQAALYGLFRATGPFSIEGSYNFGPKKYDGQQSWTASALIQPDFNMPQLRVGYFQPSIGVRYDDHTMLVRQTADVIGASPLIAPNFAEWGAQVNYFARRWLDLTAGVFHAGSLAENTVADAAGQLVKLIDDEEAPSYLGRVAVWPKVMDRKLNLNAGVSYLRNDDFSLMNLFGGVGAQDRVSVMVEYALSDKDGVRETRNLSVDLAYHGLRSVVLSARGEEGKTTLFRSSGDIEMKTEQVVVGAQVFLTPQIVVRPEYRWMDTETFRSDRYAAQLHLYY